MVILIMERVPATLRGELSRWMLEPKAGVFIGKISAMVRDKLWDIAQEKAKGGSGLLVYSSPTEQGFSIRTFGATSRQVVDFEGLALICVPKSIAEVEDEPAEPAMPT
ncbi:MAG: type I-E CRISPR-associated endoribonuclease Cas2 [Abitibacteriaceae bacterium]|nr:type I-E CRISPR-associated endoribonuclease Cas2 [Abditibacteriaceae bacterium]MBV9865241.1 type I-E CRISPR-associated endoribonuclease Cas2 [Abditibacteriaceae bacterium]